MFVFTFDRTLFKFNAEGPELLYTSWVKYPRSEKLGFVSDYKKCLFQFLIYIITAQKKYYKKTTLQDADVQLELLRLFNDLSYDMRFIDEKRYQLISPNRFTVFRLQIPTP